MQGIKQTLHFSTLERWRLWIVGTISLFIVIAFRTQTFWEVYFLNGPDRSWDGSGHVALLQIYDRTIFPDTFGWTNAFFAGMPFPNFYPPLWYWSISALHHLGSPLFFTYKAVVLVSMLLIPLALARLSFSVTDSIASSTATALLSLIPIIEKDMMPRYAAGLTFSSTFNEGIYTEPLGFLLLIVTITSLLKTSGYVSSSRTGALLSGTLLANVFTFVSALPFLVAACIYPLSKRRSQFVNVSVVLATTLLLTAFWTVPVLTHYKYFVTMPVRPPLHEVISPGLWCWLVAGLASTLWSLTRSGRQMKVYVAGLLVTLLGCVCAYAPGLEGLPLQLPRLVAILAILLSVPTADAVWAITGGALQLIGRQPQTHMASTVALLSACLCFAGLLPLCGLDARIRSDADTADMDAILKFASLHNDGRYMVQTPHLHHDRFEARAISSYLGAQGTEAATVVFRESSISSLFYVPLENKVSSLKQAFGISSSLDNDATFLDEPSTIADAQLSDLGIRYLVRLKKEEWKRSASGTAVLSLDRWEVIELPSAPVTEKESLSVLPVLVLSDISFKRRRSGQLEANRLFEEQFRSGNFETRLALSPSQSIDAMDRLDSFGALILNKFSVHNEDAAFALIKNFSKTKPVIIIPDSSKFCRRLLDHRDQLPRAAIVDSEKRNHDVWLDERDSSPLHTDQITKAWALIDEILRGQESVSGISRTNQITTQVPQVGSVLLHQTFDPSWSSKDGSPIYLAGPSATLLLSEEALPLSFQRSPVERAALLFSISSAFCLGPLLWAGAKIAVYMTNKNQDPHEVA